MSDRDIFVSSRQERWRELETALAHSYPSAKEWSDIGALYRAVCSDLATARSAELPDDVQHYLDELAGRAHNKLYAVRGRSTVNLLRTVAADFPREIRRQWPFFWSAMLLFYGPFTVGLVGALLSVDFATAVIPLDQLASMEQMYSEDLSRGGTDDAMMAGFYIFNNVGIAFRCFATGALFGLGSVFFLVYNGLVIGTVLGYVVHVGHGLNLLTFVSGHSAWELTGIAVAGAAGMRMGWAMIVTHGRTRVGSLREAAPSLYRLVAGAAAMLLVAAMIEGFWSASPLPPPVKWVFGIVQVIIVATWLMFGGRR